ncbi:MAG: hypothetical protein GY856_30505 [bacterium]|nr:hypothetical protein [bacterium]
MMVRELLLEVPTRLTTTGQGKLSFTVRIHGNEYPEWERSCRIEGLTGTSHDLGSSPFHASGAAALLIPGDVSGTLLASVDLAEPHGGIRLTGAFQLTIDRFGDVNIRIDTADQEVGERGVVYQPINVSGVGTETLEVVGDKVHLPIPLVEEQPARSLPLEDILDLEQYLPLPERDDGIARVFSIHLGSTTVVGRCFASQLDAKSATLLQELDQHCVHWVTLWDDCRVNKVSAMLRYQPSGDQQSLLIRNVTDYSRARRELHLIDSGGTRALPPGESAEIPLEAEDLVAIGSGEGRNHRVLVRCRYEEVILGSMKLPLFRTERTTFRFPPDGSELSLQIHYLGIWLPFELETFERTLDLAAEPLKVGFTRDMVYFWIRYRHAHGLLTVSSNEDLRQCLQAR